MVTRRMAVVMVLVALLGGALSLPVSSSQEQTILRVSPTSLNFEDEVGETPRAKLLTLVNTGEAVLHWQATTDVDWIILGAPKGSMAGKQVIRLLILVNTQGLGAGVRQGTVTLKNLDVEEAPTQVAVKLTLRDPARLEVSPSSLSFSAQEGGGNPSSKALTIQNTGGKTLSWTASENLEWLRLSGTKGTLGAGESTQMTVTVDVSGLSASNNKGQIVVLAIGAQGSPLFVDVTLKVTGRPRRPAGSAPTGMVEVPGGSFEMGDSFKEGQSDELPVHTVNVSGFYMDQFEVTKGMWDEVASWASGHRYDIGPSNGTGQAANHPVQNVSWYEVVKWANARSEKEGLTPCYYTNSGQSMVYRQGQVDVKNEWVKWDTDCYRLPTEAEWEKAARGGAARHRFPWSDVDTIDKSRANYEGGNNESYDKGGPSGNPSCAASSDPRTCVVGSFVANGYGLFDMGGNVWEWNWDWYDSRLYASSSGRNPRGPASGSGRVSRGGGWFDFAFGVRVAHRFLSGPGDEFGFVGFRLVRAVSSLPS